ncbi:TIGR02452 family protein [Actinomadura harenae]|uniref:TIGR02452 family protein n=1 Tax=Actinomadura harenae TaxID=2483351 RepID=A0A3M2LU51_9ACTN|nr:TIGR02452 family protein [Actinomadura harenae]RMI39585.1 TIGR02452 family protein [Actinomadura harenae]
MSREPRRAQARQTLEILERGGYRAPSGHEVDLSGALRASVDGTVLHRPEELAAMLSLLPPVADDAPRTRVEVTTETTLQAARRLGEGDGTEDPLALNFASAKNPGGGFLNGAHAQEEGLARASGLYASQRAAREYYEVHRELRDPLYTDHMIYSPGVPVFRTDTGALLDEPYSVAFITSPAPNRGATRDDDKLAALPGVLRQRALKVLAAAAAHGHRRIVLGAWGCGVFRNDPSEVAEAFAAALRPDGGPFARRFETVVLAVYDTAPGSPRLAPFVRAFEGF